MPRKKKEITKKEVKEKECTRSAFFFKIDASSLEPEFNDNIKNIFSELSTNKLIFDIEDGNFNSFIQVESIESNHVFLTYGRRETQIQRAGRAEINKKTQTLSMPAYTDDLSGVYCGHCIIDFSSKIGIYMSSNNSSPAVALTTILHKHIPSVNLNCFDLGKSKKELNDIKKDIKAINKVSYITQNVPRNYLPIGLNNSLPYTKATVKLEVSPLPIKKSQIDSIINSFYDEEGNFTSNYDKLELSVISPDESTQLIDLKQKIVTKKTSIMILEKDLFNHEIIKDKLTTALYNFLANKSF